MAEHRTVMVAARVTAAHYADWREKAAAAGVSPPALLREAMARTWTASARAGAGFRAEPLRVVGSGIGKGPDPWGTFHWVDRPSSDCLPDSPEIIVQCEGLHHSPEAGRKTDVAFT